jgi:hypothetical protein
MNGFQPLPSPGDPLLLLFALVLVGAAVWIIMRRAR